MNASAQPQDINKHISYEVIVIGIAGSANDKKWQNIEIVQKRRGKRFEITFLDNSSTDLVHTINLIAARSEADYFAVVEEDVFLAQDAIEAIELDLSGVIRPDVIYGNSIIRKASKSERIVLRPAHSQERLRCQFYLGDLLLINTDFFRKLGGFSLSLPGAEIYDFALRADRSNATFHRIEAPIAVTELPKRIREGLGRVSVAVEIDSIKSSLESHLGQSGGGIVRSVSPGGVHETLRSVLGNPLVSIVIPSRGKYSTGSDGLQCLLLQAVESIVERSTYDNYEIVVVVDEVADEGVLIALENLVREKLQIITWRKPFNFSDKVNLGVVNANGSYVLILNDDISVITPDWIERLLALAQMPNVGMVGGMLFFEDGTIQHAGHAYYKGEASHVGLDMAPDDNGPLDGYLVEREIAGVTAACALMPKDVYFQAGGFSGLLPGNFNDVDLCMKVTSLGYKILWTPHSKLFHFESKTRDATVMGFEIDVNWGRWGNRMHDSDYWPYPLTRHPKTWTRNIWG